MVRRIINARIVDPKFGTRMFARTSGYPLDLRDAGDPHDPAFDRPLVVGRIAEGVVDVRDRVTGEMVRHEVGRDKTKEVIKIAPQHELAVKEVDVKHEEARSEMSEEKAVRRPLTQERIEKAAELYNEGKSYRVIGDELGVKRGSVAYYLKLAEEQGLVTLGRESFAKTGATQTDHLKTLVEDAVREIKATTSRIDGLVGRVEDLSKRITQLEEEAVARTALEATSKSRTSSFEELWKPVAEHLREQMQEIERFREEMRDLGLAFDDYFPSPKSPISAENGGIRRSGVA